MRSTWILVGVLVGLSLGCAGILQYGEEVGRASVASGQPFKVTWTPKTSEPHHLWFDIDLTAKGSYEVEGKLKFEGETWEIDLTESGSPIKGRNTRTTMNWLETDIGSRTSVSGQIFGVELPGTEAGAPVTIKGKLRLAKGTTGRVDVVVTD